MSMKGSTAWLAGICALGAAAGAALPTAAVAADAYQIAVSNERSNDVTIISGSRFFIRRHHPGRQTASRHSCESGR